MQRRLPRYCLLLVAASLACALAPSASASQLIDRNATDVTLQLNSEGEALLTYRADGKLKHVLAWGAVNASPPTAGVPQVKLQLDYSGGYEKYFKENPAARQLAAQFAKIKGRPGYLANPIVGELQQVQKSADLYWKTGFDGGCGTYNGPQLAWSLITCKAADGSYWAVQSWQRELPDYGVTPTPAQAVWELRLSHWTGPLPVLTIHTDWAWHQWDHLYGTLSYLGRPAFGFHSASDGNPLDGYGRNIYIDTLDSSYGSGWRRENSVLTHKGTGVFCYSFNPHGNNPAGNGSRYRVTVIGPGVTPDVSWEGPSPGPYNQAADERANDEIAALHDSACLPN